jgi:chromosome segregation ATPase
MKEKISQLDKERESAVAEKDKKTDEFINLNKQYNQLVNERDKLRIKINKLKRRRNVDLN